jgi:hypothetical protein
MRTLIIAAVLSATTVAPAFAAVQVATYEFNNTFAADQAGAPALSPVDPLSESTFHTDTVLGTSRSVWTFTGDNAPGDQAGFTLNTTGLVNPESYSVDMVFQFTDRDGGWRRILDVQNRQSDDGFYVDTSNKLDLFPLAGSNDAWTNNTYHHVALTVDGTTVTGYLDGVSEFTTTTSIMDLDADPTDNPNQLLGAFLDNTVGGGIGEWSGGSISLFRLWDGVLPAGDVQQLAGNPFASTPEPASLGLLAAGSLLLMRRRRA